MKLSASLASGDLTFQTKVHCELFGWFHFCVQFLQTLLYVFRKQLYIAAWINTNPALLRLFKNIIFSQRYSGIHLDTYKKMPILKENNRLKLKNGSALVQITLQVLRNSICSVPVFFQDCIINLDLQLICQNHTVYCCFHTHFSVLRVRDHLPWKLHT